MRSVIFILFFLILFSCQKEDDYINNVIVDIDLNLSLPEYTELQIVGNSIFINGGVKGIIVYYQGFETYKTYERSCTYEPSLNCARIDSVNSTIAICNCCDSKFLLGQEGQAIDGPALLPLKQYQNTLSGQILEIYN
tara:strand:+ start:39859 stop:40269 length:411 start_codon:yes stop_codon:yes gene_type:complete